MSVRTIFLPLLIINYVFGLRIVQIPIKHLRQCVVWFGLFYILLLWLIYYSLRVNMLSSRFLHYFDPYLICTVLCESTMLFSFLFGIYHSKKLGNCLKKLAIVDATLEKLGIITNYQQLRRQIIWIILAWFLISMLIITVQIPILKEKENYNTMSAIYITNLLYYCHIILLLGDLTMTSIIRYIDIKFRQINELLENMANNNKYGIIQVWDNTVLPTSQRQIAKTSRYNWMILIIIQLHLELRKISRELDSIFGVEMTLKMGLYFIFVASNFNIIFHVIFIHNFISQKALLIIITLSWSFLHIMKPLIINLVCEKVSGQANLTKIFLNKLLSSIKDVETCENFVASVGTVLVIVIQAHTVPENYIKTL